MPAKQDNMQIHERKVKFGWDGDGDIGEMLIQQMLDGIKTATCDMKCLCTQQEIADLNANPAWVETVIDKAGKPRCNVPIADLYDAPTGNRIRVATAWAS